MMETEVKKTVPIELAVRMKSLGIRQRKSDGRFTFKLPCPICRKILKGMCFCANTLDEAIRVVETKSNPYICSDGCLWKFDEWWASNDLSITEILRDADEEIPGRSLFALKIKHPRIYRRLQKRYQSMMDRDDGDWEYDGFEMCDCEIEREP